MPLLINLRHVEKEAKEYVGNLSAADLELEKVDELIHFPEPLRYDLTAELLEDALLVQGSLSLRLECECVRCLKPFHYDLDLEHWVGHLPLEGEDKVPVVNDCVDLTPPIREDILLAFPQHPLCGENCKGLSKTVAAKLKKETVSVQEKKASAAWASLDKLKL